MSKHVCKNIGKNSWLGWPGPNHSTSIPVHLYPEYQNYWAQWYGRRARAERKRYDV